MANPLDSIVDVTVSFTGAAIPTAKGFGIPLILGLKDGTYAGNTLEVKSESELLNNGFVSTDAEYLTAKQIFAQNPKPEKAVIGKVVGYDPKYKVDLTPLSGQIAVGKKYNYTIDIGDGSPIPVASGSIEALTPVAEDACDVIEGSLKGLLRSDHLTATPTINTLTLDVSVGGATAVTATFAADTIADAEAKLDALTGVRAVIVNTDQIDIFPEDESKTIEVTGGTALSVFKFPSGSVSKKTKVIGGSLLSKILGDTPAITGLTLDVSVNGGAAVTASFTASTIAEAQTQLNGLTGVTAAIVNSAGANDRILLTPTDPSQSIKVTGGTALAAFGFPATVSGDKVVTLIDVVDATSKVTLEVVEQGKIFGLTKSNIDFDLLEVTPAPTGTLISDALSAIRSEKDDWYAVILPYGGKQLANDSALASVITGQERTLFFNSIDDEVLKDSAGNIAETLFDLGSRERWVMFFHHNAAQMPHAAWAGKVLPEDPGSVTWAFKSLAGVVAESFTTSEESNLDANNVNRYVTISGLSITRQGESSRSGFFIDVVRGIDFIKARMQERIFGQLATLKKIPFTDPGIAVVENEIRSVLRLGISQGVLSSDPQPVVIVPRAADVSAANKANRILPDVEFSATLAGAVHKITIAGTVSV